MVAAHYFPCRSCERVKPFFLMAAGAAYEKDRTTLTLTNDYLDESLRVDNDGWFPAATAGVGVEITLVRRPRLVPGGGGRLLLGPPRAPRAGRGLARAGAPKCCPTTIDRTNYWIGIGRRFGAPETLSETR